MQDLASGSVTRHLLKTTSYMLVTMVVQTLYFLVDLYWVGRLGTDAVAAVAIAGNITFIILALTQMLGVGTTTLVSHAVGRREHDQACMMFNQSQVLSMFTGVLVLIVGLIVRTSYANAMSADTNTARLAGEYLMWFIPAMALQFALVAMSAALRGIGNFKPTMFVSTTTVVINIVLAPFLIFGWGTGHPFGVAGAAMATFIAIVVGVIWMTMYFLPRGAYLRFMAADWKPSLKIWKRLLGIGLPAGFEFALMAVYMALVYTISRPFGAAAQAGFGIGQRVVQAGFMPIVALGISVAPVAGQNFGARLPERVKQTFKNAAVMAVAWMLLMTIVCNIAPEALVKVFAKDPAVIAVGAEYLRIISFTFAASGLIFVSSSMFQAMGNTLPSLISSGTRIVLVGIPAVILTRSPGFQLNWIWYLSAASIVVQLAMSLTLLRREFARRLDFSSSTVPSVPPVTSEAVSA